MPRIKIEDLPVMEELSKEEMESIVGGFSSAAGLIQTNVPLGNEGPGGGGTGIEDGLS